MSAIRSILLHLDSSERCAERIRIAANLATTFDAQVSGVYSVIPSMLRYPLGLDATSVLVDLERYDEECRRKASRLFNGQRAAGNRMRWEDVPGDAIGSLACRAIYADLLVLGQRDDAMPLAAETPSDFVFDLLARSGRPALVVPFAGSFASVGRTVLIAWKASREAARAVASALPWLSSAHKVHAIGYGEHAEQSLQCLQAYLSCHQVRVTAHLSAVRDVSVGEDLLSRAADLGADMMVMGCYGHSRAREWMLGGVSRSILRAMTVPVLMAH